MPDLTSVTQTFNAAKDSAAAYTSGVSALPGGLGAMATVVDNAKSAISAIPGVGALSSLPGVSAVAGALSKLPGVGALGGMASAAGSLATDAVAGLSAKDATAVNTAMAGLSSSLMKPPVVAEGTFDDSAIKSMSASLLGSGLIPSFNRSGNPATFGSSMSAESVKKYDENKAAIAQTYDEYLAQMKLTRDAQAAYENAKNELPQGDPKIDQLKAAFISESGKESALEKKLAALRSA